MTDFVMPFSVMPARTDDDRSRAFAEMLQRAADCETLRAGLPHHRSSSPVDAAIASVGFDQYDDGADDLFPFADPTIAEQVICLADSLRAIESPLSSNSCDALAELGRLVGIGAEIIAALPTAADPQPLSDAARYMDMTRHGPDAALARWSVSHCDPGKIDTYIGEVAENLVSKLGAATNPS